MRQPWINKVFSLSLSLSLSVVLSTSQAYILWFLSLRIASVSVWYREENGAGNALPFPSFIFWLLFHFFA